MKQIRALVVDDNRQNLKILVKLLSKQGIHCIEVVDPRTLPALLPTLAGLDVAFVDLEMPGLDGYEVKDLLRDQLGAVPIIAYTVHISEMNTVKACGFDGFLGKPLDMTRFPDQLNRILKHEPVWERA